MGSVFIRVIRWPFPSKWTITMWWLIIHLIFLHECRNPDRYFQCLEQGSTARWTEKIWCDTNNIGKKRIKNIFIEPYKQTKGFTLYPHNYNCFVYKIAIVYPSCYFVFMNTGILIDNSEAWSQDPPPGELKFDLIWYYLLIIKKIRIKTLYQTN